MDTIRTNVRVVEGKTSYITVIKDIYNRTGGYRNFYRGFGLYCMTQIPVFALTMGMFEKMMDNKK